MGDIKIRIEGTTDKFKEGLQLLVDEKQHVNSHLFQIELKEESSVTKIKYYEIKHSIPNYQNRLTTNIYHIYPVAAYDVCFYNRYQLYDDCDEELKDILKAKWGIAQQYNRLVDITN